MSQPRQEATAPQEARNGPTEAEEGRMKVYYGKEGHYVFVAQMTPKMLRQMKAWDKAKIANVSIVGYPPGSKAYILIHMDNVHVDLSILNHHG